MFAFQEQSRAPNKSFLSMNKKGRNNRPIYHFSIQLPRNFRKHKKKGVQKRQNSDEEGRTEPEPHLLEISLRESAHEFESRPLRQT